MKTLFFRRHQTVCLPFRVIKRWLREVPNGCVVLAKTDRCLHAFRVAGKPFWAFQFHPELDRACFVQRLGIFQEKYTDSAEDYEGVAAQFKETPESNQLLRRFFEHLERR